MTGKLNVLGDVYFALLPVLVSLALVLSGSVIIGIPTAMILRRRNWEKLPLYVSIGAAAGFIIPIIGLILAGAEWGPTLGMGILGAFSGSITALTWAKTTNRSA